MPGCWRTGGSVQVSTTQSNADVIEPPAPRRPMADDRPAGDGPALVGDGVGRAGDGPGSVGDLPRAAVPAPPRQMIHFIHLLRAIAPLLVLWSHLSGYWLYTYSQTWGAQT